MGEWICLLGEIFRIWRTGKETPRNLRTLKKGLQQRAERAEAAFQEFKVVTPSFGNLSETDLECSIDPEVGRVCPLKETPS